MWHRAALRDLLEQVASGRRTPHEAVGALSSMPYEEIGCAKLDHHRVLRQGFPEVIFCEGKTPEQVAKIVECLSDRHHQLLGTRASAAHYQAAFQLVPNLQYDPVGRAIWVDRQPQRTRREGIVLLAAGTGDLPVAQEAAVTLELMGQRPERIHDVGVAGLHRLLAHLPALQRALVIIVIAGMDGALPGVVAGLVSSPVIAVPTSIGYGASFGGIAALLTMLNACAAGVAVVNIDNGYGAAHLAASINRSAVSATGEDPAVDADDIAPAERDRAGVGDMR